MGNPIFVRRHYCFSCNISVLKEVDYSYDTQNISGEATFYCPVCCKRSSAASIRFILPPNDKILLDMVIYE